MRKVFIIAIVILLLSNSASFAIRCGSNIVNIGDLKQEVFVACGEPISKEIIGYIDQEKNGDRIRVMKIEEWIVISGTFYYSLIFEGNKLVNFEDAGRVN